jgi:hypothetical protein
MATFVEIIPRALHEEFDSTATGPLPSSGSISSAALDEGRWPQTNASESQPAFREAINAASKARRG